MKCKLSEKCEFGNLCNDATRHDSLTVLGCSSFKTKEPMTEQEYLQTCNTEQLVHVIHLMTTCCYVCGKDGVDYKRCYFHKKCTGPKEIEEWLKQPHTKE